MLPGIKQNGYLVKCNSLSLSWITLIGVLGAPGESAICAQLYSCGYHGPRPPKVPAGCSNDTAELALPPSLSISQSPAVLETEAEGGRICQDKGTNHGRTNWFKLYELH